jgi:hypothetical protein
MSAYMLDSKVDLLRIINAKNATTFVATDLVFSPPQPLNGTWRELANPHNTAVRVTAAEGSAFQGTQVVTYDRFKLSDLANLPGFSLSADHPATVHDLFTGLMYYNGLRFTAEDLEDSPVTDNGDGTYTATLTAKAGSYGWVDSLVVNITQGATTLDTVISTGDMPGLNYPTANDTDVYAALYMYGYDMTPYYSDLVDVEEGVPLTQHQADALAVAFKAVDRSSGATLWNGDAASTSWSLAGAVATHSGMNGVDLPTNSSYKYALLLQLRDDVQTPRGTLIIHYNDPVDPGSV